MFHVKQIDMETLEHCPICNNKESNHFLDVCDHFLTKEQFKIVSCSSCGFKYINPRPTQEEIGKYYESEEYVSHSNTKKGLINQIYSIVKSYTLNRKYRMINRRVQGKKILDIGCGPGDFLETFQQKGWNCTGIEVNEEARNIAHEKGLHVLPEEELENLPQKEYDTITMWHVLEHIHELNSRIETVKRLLKREGSLIVAVPNCAAHDAVHYEKFWAAYDVPRHIYHFQRKDIQRLFEKHAMEVEEILPMKFDSYYISMLSEKYKNEKGNLGKALWVGVKSNLKAKRTEDYSSLIYIIKNRKQQ